MDPPSTSVTSFGFHDPEMMAAAIQGADLNPCQLSARPGPSRLVRVQCPRICLDLTSVGPAMLYTGVMPKDCYTLMFVVSCPGTGRLLNFGIKFSDSYIGLFPPGAPLDGTNPADCVNAILTVPADVFHAAMASCYPEMPDHVLSRGGAMRVGADEQVHLRSLLTSIDDAIRNPGEHSPARLSCCGFERALLPAFLGALRSGCSAIAPQPDARVARRHQRLSQAREFITAHEHKPIHVEDLCSHLGLSARGVENLFRDLTGLSPAAFLRRQRLHHVHRTLQRATPESGKVKEVALGAGFWHLGHFCQNYRCLFGESPSETLSQDVT